MKCSAGRVLFVSLLVALQHQNRGLLARSRRGDQAVRNPQVLLCFSEEHQRCRVEC